MTTSKTQTDTQTLRLERTSDSTLEEAWTAWTEADQFAKGISSSGSGAEGA